MEGLIRREDGLTSNFHDILVYSRLLTEKEVRDYELTLIGWSEEQ